MPRGDVFTVDATMNKGPLGGVVNPNPIAIGSVERMFVALSVSADAPRFVPSLFGITFAPAPFVIPEGIAPPSAISFPVVPEKTARWLFTAEAGPTTLPGVPPDVIAAHTPAL